MFDVDPWPKSVSQEHPLSAKRSLYRRQYILVKGSYNPSRLFWALLQPLKRTPKQHTFAIQRLMASTVMSDTLL